MGLSKKIAFNNFMSASPKKLSDEAHKMVLDELSYRYAKDSSSGFKGSFLVWLITHKEEVMTLINLVMQLFKK